MKYEKTRWMRLIVGALLATAATFVGGCSSPKIYPVTKSAEEAVKEIDEHIKNSPTLQAIDRLCTKEIPVFDGLKLKNRIGWDKAGNPFIAYTYSSDIADNLKVRGFYKDHLSQQGWQVTKDQIGGVGPPWNIEFHKADNWISLTYHGVGEGGAIYTLTCTKLTASQ